MGDNLVSYISGLDTVLEDYIEWFTFVVRYVSYPEREQDERQYSPPQSFQVWMGKAAQVGFAEEIIQSLSVLHSDLTKQAEKVVEYVTEQKKAPEFEDYDVFITLFEEFIRNLRRIEIDFLTQESAVDPLTGFRSPSLLYEDLGCEMDRLSRQGKPFCLALVRIDNFEDMKKTGDVSEVIKLVAKMIKKSMRSFDDAYRISDEEFILSLKQADIEGGIRALERLKQELHIYDRESDGTSGLNLSSCVAEPVPDDNVHELVKNLKLDLNSVDKLDEGSVLEYHELSPLERFVEGGGQD